MVFGWLHKSNSADAHKAARQSDFRETTALPHAKRPATEAPAKLSDSELLRQQRAKLFDVIGECMIASGILSAGYKFKVMSADAQHQQFLVMFDLNPEFATDTHQLGGMEQLIQITAQRRYGLLVKACYWRVIPDPSLATDHIASGMAGMDPVESSPDPSVSTLARAQLADMFPMGVPENRDPAFQPTEISGSTSSPAPSYAMLTGYENTELAQSEFKATELQTKR